VTAPVVFVDTETTGFDPDLHEIWEVALIEADGTEHQWFLPVDLAKADPAALKIGRFHERHPWGDSHLPPATAGMAEVMSWAADVPSANWFARSFAKLTAGKHLVGAVISFDEERLRKLLRANGARPDWHYHLVDVEALVAGEIAARTDCASTFGGVVPGHVADGLWVQVKPTPPWNSNELSLAVGVNPADFDRHTALGDARWAKALYEAVIGTDES
jgi:hypothetical protein